LKQGGTENTSSFLSAEWFVFYLFIIESANRPVVVNESIAAFLTAAMGPIEKDGLCGHLAPDQSMKFVG
jgi:hypothetical protein